MSEVTNKSGKWRLSKSDFLYYLDAPMHLWAKRHDQADRKISDYDRHLMEQGKQVGMLGQDFLQWYVGKNYDGAEVSFEATLEDGKFEARIDGLVFDTEAEVYDLYEVKGSTGVKKEHIFDAAFQRLAAEGQMPVRSVYLVVLDGEYVREGEVDLRSLFTVMNVNEKVAEVREEVLLKRELAWEAGQREEPDGIEGCERPKTCPCVNLCHGELPEHSIYNLPRLSKPKKRELKGMGILQTRDIPSTFPLTDKQSRHAQAVKEGKAIIDHKAIQKRLDELDHPLYFLDYETYNPAVPMFDGYRPYEQIVFQYSLHVHETPTGEMKHFEHLETGKGDVSRRVVSKLAEDIGDAGSIIVWNMPFEATRNKEMAKRYPEYAEFLLGLNERMFDLMRIFSDGLYVDADFHGSASIKAVLPALVGEGGYEELLIGKGDEAMMAWVEIVHEMVVEEQVERVREELLKYCELDTLAMVRNLEFLQEAVSTS